MNLCRSSEMIMQFGGPVLGATMKKGRLHVATCLSCLSCYSFYNFFTISMPLSINLTLIKLCSDRLTLLEAFCFFLPIRLYLILEGQFLTYNVCILGWWGEDFSSLTWVRHSAAAPAVWQSLQELQKWSRVGVILCPWVLEGPCSPGFSSPLELCPLHPGERAGEELWTNFGQGEAHFLSLPNQGF